MKPNSNLAVCSVFSGNDHTAFWLQQQLNGLKRSLPHFDHLVYLNQTDEQIFSESIIVGQSEAPPRGRYRGDGFHFSSGMAGHFKGLKELTAFCTAYPYEYFLVLDSDCFPIHDRWLEILLDAMGSFGKSYAAPARAENLDTFPHPCALFTADPQYLRFAGDWNENLVGWMTRDIICAGETDDWFPLLKSNRHSRHPLLASIYYDLFYHHGAGSRKFNMRSLCYYDSVIQTYPDAGALLDELKTDPDAFIASMR
jgi:hypothetical protein